MESQCTNDSQSLRLAESMCIKIDHISKKYLNSDHIKRTFEQIQCNHHSMQRTKTNELRSKKQMALSLYVYRAIRSSKMYLLDLKMISHIADRDLVWRYCFIQRKPQWRDHQSRIDQRILCKSPIPPVWWGHSFCIHPWISIVIVVWRYVVFCMTRIRITTGEAAHSIPSLCSYPESDWSPHMWLWAFPDDFVQLLWRAE